jgi:ABC-type transport system substrate-binding protein
MRCRPGQHFRGRRAAPRLADSAGSTYLNAVDFVYISDDNQRVLQLKSGQVQVISAVPRPR